MNSNIIDELLTRYCICDMSGKKPRVHWESKLFKDIWSLWGMAII